MSWKTHQAKFIEMAVTQTEPWGYVVSLTLK